MRNISFTDNTPFSYKNLFGKVYAFIEIIPQTILISAFVGGLFYFISKNDLSIYIGSGLYIFFVYVRLILRIQRVEYEQKDFERENNIEPVKK